MLSISLINQTMKITTNRISRYPLPEGGFFEYDIDVLGKMLYGRIFDSNGRRLATARQAIWPWTKLMTPEEMFRKVLAKL